MKSKRILGVEVDGLTQSTPKGITSDIFEIHTTTKSGIRELPSTPQEPANDNSRKIPKDFQTAIALTSRNLDSEEWDEYMRPAPPLEQEKSPTILPPVSEVALSSLEIKGEIKQPESPYPPKVIEGLATPIGSKTEQQALIDAYTHKVEDPRTLIEKIRDKILMWLGRY